MTFFIFNFQPASGSTKNKSTGDTNFASNNLIDNHLIENVPYVSQETGLYCAYAGATMIFKYYGIDTSLEEVLFITGAGSSLVYDYNQDTMMAGFTICRNYSYICRLYNLSLDIWNINITGMTKENLWNQYWPRVKENISNNCPVWTYANPFRLNTSREVGNFPDFAYDVLLSSHMTVIVGYNESNNSICFNDPMCGVFGKHEIGTYAWMDLDYYKEAIWSAAEFHKDVDFSSHMSILTFNKISDPPENKIYLKKVYEKNIERMKGNKSSYDGDVLLDAILDELEDYLGINAVKSLQEDYQQGLLNQISQVRQLKKNNKLSPLMILAIKLLKIDKSYASAIDENVARPYILYLRDKEFQYNFLEKNSDILQISNEELSLYKQEINYWKELFDHYKIFVKRGLSLSFIRGSIKVRQMNSVLEKIIEIQNEIIWLSTTSFNT